VATLTDASRRALYDYVRRQDHPVHREEAAEATAMSRGLAAFHLDKLVQAGLLTARYQAPPDQPRGRGRAPKVYEAAGDDLSVTVPARRYELIADILAEAASERTEPADVARRRGRQLGEAHRRAGVTQVLGEVGFEPRDHGDAVVLRNCPFHALAGRYTSLVCGLNLAFVTGILEGLGDRGTEAALVPRPGSCCVELRSRDEPPSMPG
jgi:predicted ArsR family transcriptional regulator